MVIGILEHYDYIIYIILYLFYIKCVHRIGMIVLPYSY